MNNTQCTLDTVAEANEKKNTRELIKWNKRYHIWTGMVGTKSYHTNERCALPWDIRETSSFVIGQKTNQHAMQWLHNVISTIIDLLLIFCFCEMPTTKRGSLSLVLPFSTRLRSCIHEFPNASSVSWLVPNSVVMISCCCALVDSIEATARPQQHTPNHRNSKSTERRC